MPIAYDWSIPTGGLERSAADGSLRAVHWRLRASDGGASGDVYGAVVVPEADRARLAAAGASVLLPYVEDRLGAERIVQLKNAAARKAAGADRVTRADAAA